MKIYQLDVSGISKIYCRKRILSFAFSGLFWRACMCLILHFSLVIWNCLWQLVFERHWNFSWSFDFFMITVYLYFTELSFNQSTILTVAFSLQKFAIITLCNGIYFFRHRRCYWSAAALLIFLTPNNTNTQPSLRNLTEVNQQNIIGSLAVTKNTNKVRESKF